MDKNIDLSQYVKYARDYLNLSRGFSSSRSQKLSIDISQFFNLEGLLNGDLDGSIEEMIELDNFYGDKTEEEKESAEYKKEFKVAKAIEEVLFKFENNSFTQEIKINFCNIKYRGRRLDPETNEFEEFQEFQNPLCSIGVILRKDDKTGEYSVEMSDDQILIHIEPLWHYVNERVYYELTKILARQEKNSSLFLPKEDLDFLDGIIDELKAATQTAEDIEILGDEKEKVTISIEPKSNYFLVEDLEELSAISGEDLKGSALSIWSEENKDQNVSGGENIFQQEERELYFPFPYDRFKLATLPLLEETVSVIEGPPGTGKSELIANLLVHLAAHDKKVLFVSQKAQALKVVKDKLKSLEVDGLFGYFPNKQSLQLSDEDHKDSVTSMFSKVEQMALKTIGNISKEDVLDAFTSIEDGRKSFNDYFANQRKFYHLRNEIDAKYKVYDDLDIEDSKLTVMKWADMKNDISEKDFVSDSIKNFAGKTFDKIDKVKCTADVYNSLNEIRSDFHSTAYDRNINLVKKSNEVVRRLRQRKHFGVLPNEINYYVKEIEKTYRSKQNARDQIDELYKYVEFKYFNDHLKEIETLLEKKLNEVNIELDKVIDLIHLQKELNISDEEFVDQIKSYKKLKNELEMVGNLSSDPNIFTDNEGRYFNIRKEKIKLYLRNILRNNAERILDTREVLRIVKRLAKAFSKSKRAFKTFDTLKGRPEDFESVYGLFPVWIMELDDASRILPLKKDLFDYVILDEASQCDIAYTLPSMFRSKRAIFVGDSKQMKGASLGFMSNRAMNQLADKYEIPEDLQIKPKGEAAMSVLDIFLLQGVRSRTLQYHYRSPKELIGFSNEYFYESEGRPLISLNKNHVTWEDTGRVIVKHIVDVDYNIETSDKINKTEAKKSLELYNELRSKKEYKNFSIGILTFFNEQATEIRSLFVNEGIKDDNLLISTIEGIQGDEKDIVIYSFAIKTPEEKKRYVALTGEGGDIRKDIAAGRVNVAFSRAKKQVHIISSLDTSEFPSGVWLKKYLEYADDNGLVDTGGTELKPFDSYFEEEFYGLLSKELSDGYLIRNQVKSLGFKIDFVVTKLANGKKIAIECDGPSHFEDEMAEEFNEYVAHDVDRQLILESAGWEFYRIPYSKWSKKEERSEIVKEIEKMLN